MQGCWTGLLATLVILVGLTGAEPSNQIIDGPRNATVLVGAEARFNCTVSQGWKLIMWALNETVVVLSRTPSEVIVTNSRFTSESYSVGGNFVFELIIHSVQLWDAGTVRCSLQDNVHARTALLSVQAVGTLSILSTGELLRDEPCNVTCLAADWTPLPELSWALDINASHWSYASVPDASSPRSVSSVLTLVPHESGAVTCVARMEGLSEHLSVTANLTVVSSRGSDSRQVLPTWAIALLAVSFSLLLVLIIVLVVIFCCCSPSRRGKKAPRYLSEIRKPAGVKANETLEARTQGGCDNRGYSSEEQQEGKGVASLPAKSSEPSDTDHEDCAWPQQEPRHHQPRPGSGAHVSFLVTSPRTTRNVTLV